MVVVEVHYGAVKVFHSIKGTEDGIRGTSTRGGENIVGSDRHKYRPQARNEVIKR
jgi:hypothetical protein